MSEVLIVIRAINQSRGAFGQANRDISSFNADMLKAGAILAGFSLVAKKAYDFGKEGAQIERLRETGTKLAESFGVDMDEAVAKIKAASLGTISANKAIMEANRSLLLGVARDADTMAKLMEIAAIRGRAAGLGTQDAFDRITLGIGRLSTRILDDIGIVVDGETAYADYAESIGKVADDLTEAEKRIALTNAIIEDGNKLLRDTGGLVEDNAVAFERFSANTEDVTNKLKEMASVIVSRVVVGLDTLLTGYFQIARAIKEHKDELRNSTLSQAEYEKEVARTNRTTVAWLSLMTGALTPAIIDLIEKQTGLEITVDALTESERSLIREVDERRQAEADLKQFIEERAEAEKELIKVQQEARDSFEGIRSAIEDFDMEAAGKAVVEFLDAAGLDENATVFERVLSTHLGTLSGTMRDFIRSIEELSADGELAWDEFLQAFQPVRLEQAARKTIEIQDEFDKAIEDARKERDESLGKLNQDFDDGLIDDQTDLNRKLEDLERETAEKRAEEDERKKRKAIDREAQYQRRLRNIMEQFERSRLQALIDLDARALFEAEYTRNQQLRDLEEDRKSQADDDEEDRRRKEQDDRDDYEKRRQRILREYERDREDAKRAYDKRRKVVEAAFEKEVDAAKDARKKEMDDLEEWLRQGTIAQNFEYTQRISDLIKYWQGVLQVNELYRGIIGGGGSGNPPGYQDPSAGEPGPDAPIQYPPDEPYTPGPSGPGGLPIPSLVAGGFQPSSSGAANVRVTLNIEGDGMIAQLVRDSALNAIVDVIAE